jgi:hypothetical protein
MFAWDDRNNPWLAENRNITFEHIVIAIENDGILEIFEHPLSWKYQNQKIMAVKLGNYVYAVPFIELPDGTVFLKTIYPSRKLTKRYLNNGENDGA